MLVYQYKSDTICKANRYGTTKNKNEQISVGHFCEKHATGAKKMEMSQFVFVGLCFFVAIEKNEAISVGGHKKNADLRNCSRLSKHCTKPASEDEMCPNRVSFSYCMCPRWASFSNFKLGG